jgi:hypothetical protein
VSTHQPGPWAAEPAAESVVGDHGGARVPRRGRAYATRDFGFERVPDAVTRLWLDHLLSQRAQALSAQQAGLGAVRSDAQGELTVNGLRSSLKDALRPIVVGPGLLTFLDQAKRNDFLRRWRQRVPPR